MKEPSTRPASRTRTRPLRQAAGQAFYNTSPFTLRDLQRGQPAAAPGRLRGLPRRLLRQRPGDPGQVRVPQPDSRSSIEGRRPRAAHREVPRPDINLSPNPSSTPTASQAPRPRQPRAWAPIFEELIRRFNEENNEEAGEHWTPRDVVQLMAQPDLPARRGPDPVGHLPRLRRRLRHRRHADGRRGDAARSPPSTARKPPPTSTARRSTPRPTPSARPTCCSRARARRPTTSSAVRLDPVARRLPVPRVRLHALQPALRQELEDRPGADGRQGGHQGPRFMVEHAGDPEFSLSPGPAMASCCSWSTCSAR